MRALWAVVILAAAASPAAARDPLLGLPIDCTLGDTCFIQNFVDADGGPGAADFTCGLMSYDGHKGTDFALPSHMDALDGVAVLAAAPGVVKGTRDGVSDSWFSTTADFPDGQDCGNGVVIDHGGGWETQYCHLKNGSVTVRQGQRVGMGAELGLTGMSGNTQFPHLHLSVRHEGQVVDPFNTDAITTCGEVGDDQLWQTPPNYVPGGLIQAGFSFGVPGYDLVKFGKAHAPRLPADAPGLVLWGHLFGGRAGDVLHMTIEGPAGTFSDKRITLDKAQAQAMRATGRKLHVDNRMAGDYTGHVELFRAGALLDRITVTTTLIAAP
ncbi:M23 family metallopeptidase [Aliiroseovarius subalbicans]|uniref:M23 family metallopeptidase n=1 Tax=Aliiroseovarius subalbicans TaxID=2925840 RepID=UPI001F58A6E5|nr:M23 family metallopeptidase [Aliiroseovarius subalbicans]MCI2400608.1 M23 family metallopeptidase [Aliiroseovarius subalbicans]